MLEITGEIKVHADLEASDEDLPGHGVAGLCDKVIKGVVGGCVHEQGAFHAGLVLGEQGLMD